MTMELTMEEMGARHGDATLDIHERPARSASPRTVHNVADPERVASVALGAVLIGLGVRRRDAGGMLAAIAGGLLVHRGATGHCMVYGRLGISTGDAEAVLDSPRRDITGRSATVNARKAIKVEHRVRVAAPREMLYAFWRRFENLPRVMRHLESVSEISASQSHWKAKAPAGMSVEWDAELVNDIPDRLIAWKSVGSPQVPNAGSVHFDDAAGGGTMLRVVLDYEPPAGRTGRVIAQMFGEDPDTQVREDLATFKADVESGRILGSMS